MDVVATIERARELCRALPGPVGFIPTMGALHEGHLELVRHARAECAAVGASVFVNPLQFGAGEDLDRYPRDTEGDRAKLASSGVDVLFVPAASDMYDPQFSTAIDIGEIGRTFEGAIRPAHFCGVATVVVKLLNIVGPDVLYLGQKDAQQTAVIRKVVRDLDISVRVRIIPTVREADGLALSSRNRFLSPKERAAAPTLHGALTAFREAMQSGLSKSEAYEVGRRVLARDAALDYLDVVDADSFAPIDELRKEAFVIAAARFGSTRLLDNQWIAA